MKSCSKCHQEKPATEYLRRPNRRGDKYYSRCLSCRAEDSRAYRLAFPNVLKERDKAKRLKRRYMVIKYLIERKCVDCGMADPRCLEFDHIKERGRKLFTIGHEISHTKPMEVIFKEMRKCETRCANCHRIKTAERNPSHWSNHDWFIRLMAGSPGVEPRQGESKSPVLPLHHEPIRRGRTPGVQLLLI